MVVDGDMGTVVVNPPAEVTRNYRDLQKKREAYRSALEQTIPLPSETLDGRTVRLWANIGSLVDLEYALHFGAYGIGLFRTELPFLALGRLLSEEEQSMLYRKVVEQTNGREVTIRTLDFGGDKFFGEERNPKEKEPLFRLSFHSHFLEGEGPIQTTTSRDSEGKRLRTREDSVSDGLKHRERFDRSGNWSTCQKESFGQKGFPLMNEFRSA